MARIPRRTLPDGMFHVTTNSVHEVSVFRDDADRRFFVALMKRLPKRFGLRIHAYCLMGTHYHLIVEGTTNDLSDAFRWLNGVYAREHNARHGRRGHLFAERFASWVIRDEHHLAAATDYVLDNPVRAGLVLRRDDWRWSGAPAKAPRSLGSAAARADARLRHREVTRRQRSVGIPRRQDRQCAHLVASLPGQRGVVRVHYERIADRDPPVPPASA